MLAGLLPVAGVSGLNLADLIEPEQISALIAGEKHIMLQFNNPQPQLTPRHDVLKRHIETKFSNLDPSLMIEILYLYKKPRIARRNGWSIEEETELYNEALALSSLVGIEYFSMRAGAMRTLLTASQVIDGPSTKRPLPDPVYLRPQAELTVYARQKDTTFGDNIYQYDYYSAPEALILAQENLTSLTIGFIPAVGKNRLRSIAAVLDAGDYLLVYGVSMVKSISVPGMKERIGNAFSNRVDAILEWFSGRADKAFRKAHEI